LGFDSLTVAPDGLSTTKDQPSALKKVRKSVAKRRQIALRIARKLFIQFGIHIAAVTPSPGGTVFYKFFEH